MIDLNKISEPPKTYFVEIPLEEEAENQLKIRVVNNFFIDQKTRKESIKTLTEYLDKEKKKWLKETCGFRWQDFKKGNFREKLYYILTIPLDWYFINRYFNLLKKNAKEIIELCNLELKKERIEIRLKELKKINTELRFLDKGFTDYCQLSFSYYQNLLLLFQKKFLYFDEDEETNQRVKAIKEAIC